MTSEKSNTKQHSFNFVSPLCRQLPSSRCGATPFPAAAASRTAHPKLSVDALRRWGASLLIPRPRDGVANTLMRRRLSMRWRLALPQWLLLLLLCLPHLQPPCMARSILEQASFAVDDSPGNHSNSVTEATELSPPSQLPSTSLSSTHTHSAALRAPGVPFIRPLLAVGDVVSAADAGASQSRHFDRFELVEYVHTIAVPTVDPFADSAALQRSAALDSPRVVYTERDALRLVTPEPRLIGSTSQALVSSSDSVSLLQLEQLVSLSHLSLSVPPLSPPDPAPSALGDIMSRLGADFSFPLSMPAESSDARASQTSSSEPDFDYMLHSRIGRGGYGEIWKARRARSAEQMDGTGAEQAEHGMTDESADEYFILKRLLLEKGEHVRASGLREVEFGERLAGLPHVARFVSWFEVRGELWLVFRHEGLSLADYMRRMEVSEDGATGLAGRPTLTPEWRMLREDMMDLNERWLWQARRRDGESGDDNARAESSSDESIDIVDMDLLPPPHSLHALPSPAPTIAETALLTASGSPLSPAVREPRHSEDATSGSPPHTPLTGRVLRDLLHQVITGVAEGHRLGIYHRDIKPQNVLLRLHRHHPHHRLLQHRLSHDFLSVDDEIDEQRQDERRNDTTEATHQKLQELPSSVLATSINSTSIPTSTSATPDASATFSIPSTASSLGHVRMCDYGSAVDTADGVTQRLYGADGPSLLESTLDYAPPELLFSSSLSAPPSSLFGWEYDSWSLGVLILELVLGGRERVFALDSRVKALIQARLGSNVRPDVVEKAILLRAFIEYCIYPAAEEEMQSEADAESSEAEQQPDEAQSRSRPQYEQAIRGGSCNHTHVADLLRQYDPLGVGLGDLSELSVGAGTRMAGERGGLSRMPRSNELLYTMVRGLLQWQPHLRLSAEDALQHAYFHGDWYRCGLCGDEFELPAQLQAHVHSHDEPSNARRAITRPG